MTSIAWTAVAVLALTGCDSNHYEIEMKPDGKTMSRDLTVWRGHITDGKQELVELPADELDRIAKAYGDASPEAAAKKFRFSGKFAEQSPGDVGGAGWYVPLECPMGRTAGYVERFRGNDDLSADMNARLAATDALIDTTVAWLKSAVGSDEGFAELHKALDGPVRSDARNLCLYAWAYAVASEDLEDAEERFGVRVAQYLIERDYFRPHQAVALVRAFDDSEEGDPAALLAIVRSVVAKKMGVAAGGTEPKALRIFDDPARIESTLDAYLSTTDRYRKLLQKWEEKKKEFEPDEPPAKPEPTEVLVDLALEAFLPGILGKRDEVTVGLSLPKEPFATNGTWDGVRQRVAWSKQVMEAKSELPELPAILYAFWSEPNVKTQERHFGKVVFDGQSLATYCLWYRGLKKPEAAQWDKFVGSLSPDADLAAAMDAFLFDGEPRPDPGRRAPSRADRVKEIVLPILTGKPWSPPEPPSPGQ